MQIEIYNRPPRKLKSTVRLEIVPSTPAENPVLPVIPTDENRIRLLLYAVRLNVGATSLSKFDWYDYRDDSNVCGDCRCILGKCKVTEMQSQLAMLIAQIGGGQQADCKSEKQD